MLSFLAPTSANAAPNDLTLVASAAAAAAQLVDAGSGITVVGGSETILGSQVKSFTSIDLGTIDGTAYNLNTPGIFLTSSTASGAVSGAPSSALRSQMQALWAATGASTESVTNVSSLSFDFTTNSPSTTSIDMDFLFTSYEFANDSYDLAMVIVDGVNYAFFPGNRVLRVSPESQLADVFSARVYLNNIWLYSAAPSQSLVALLNPSLSTHSITIAVADTRDNVVETMFMVSPLRASSSTSGGVLTAPGSPTIGTATATGATTATVTFTAPASNGGSAILSYTATSNPGNITSTVTQSGSGTITLTGLSPATAYTFTVTALNAIGSSVASNSSNSITTFGLGLNPTFSQPSSFDFRFTVQITNFDSNYTYSVTSTAGQATINSTGLVTVTGIGPNQSATITVTATRIGYNTGSASITGSAQVAPMLPTNKPTLTITDTLITCTIGSYSATPTSTAFSLFVDGVHVSTIFSTLGEFLPDWIIPWATSSTITRTADLTFASWALSDVYKGKAITCATLAYSKNAIGLTASAPLTAR